MCLLLWKTENTLGNQRLITSGTSEKKLQARKIKDTFISLLHTQCVLASGKSGCKTTAHKRDFDVGDGEEGALCKKRQQCH